MTDDTGDEPRDEQAMMDGTDGDGTGGGEGTGGRQMNGMSGEGPGESEGPRDLEGYGDSTAAGATRVNGLTAGYYVPLRDVDPRVGVELLTKLGAAGIAAYVAPTPGRKGGYGDVQPPALPTDRLWVDGAKRADAEGVIAGVTSEDEVFEQLVAMFHTSSPAEAPWPATEELGAPTRTPTWTTRRSITARQAQPPLPEVTPAGEPALPEHVERYLDEHFVPEPPPPLPKLHGVTILAWALIGLGVLMVVFHNSIPADFSQGSNLLAACAIVGGFFTLVYRMRDNDHDDDGDGAVV
jgi:hypothetical protein